MCDLLIINEIDKRLQGWLIGLLSESDVGSKFPSRLFLTIMEFTLLVVRRHAIIILIQMEGVALVGAQINEDFMASHSRKSVKSHDSFKSWPWYIVLDIRYYNTNRAVWLIHYKTDALGCIHDPKSKAKNCCNFIFKPENLRPHHWTPLINGYLVAFLNKNNALSIQQKSLDLVILVLILRSVNYLNIISYSTLKMSCKMFLFFFIQHLFLLILDFIIALMRSTF